MQFQLQPIDTESTHDVTITNLWNAACGPDLATTERFVQFNLQPATGSVQAGRLAMQGGQLVGFVLASALPYDRATSPPEIGWIEAVAVLPTFQRRGIGSSLSAWAEEWLAGQGCMYARLGGGLHYFAPGLPVELKADSFFHNRGYQGRSEGDYVWDVARDLSDYEYPILGAQSTISVRPAQTQEADAVLEFLQREFPGRWRFEFQEFMRDGGRMSDYVLLWTERGVDGCCRLTFEDSAWPVERFYMRRLPRPWGQLGSIGISADCRGKGYGAALLDGGLRHLRDSGVRGCVIDWTSLLTFYGKFGFEPYREYAVMIKELSSALTPNG
jgi:predicted N-acetyltransferase YhbS